jgi:predicted RNA-binding protein with PIN domain
MTVYLIDGYNVLHQLLGQVEDRGQRRQGGREAAGAAPGRATGSGPWSRRRSGAAGEGTGSRGVLSPGPGVPWSEAPGAGPAAGGGLDLEEERRRLIDRIASYMGGSSDRAIVVFDSHSQMLQKQESATANVEVYFGSFSRSADSIIEREVYVASAGENVIVVSSDYQLQKAIFLPNVIRRSSRQFVADLQEHTKRIANSQNCITMNHRIEERLDPGTVERLRALRDQLAAQPEEPGGGE